MRPRRSAISVPRTALTTRAIGADFSSGFVSPTSPRGTAMFSRSRASAHTGARCHLSASPDRARRHVSGTFARSCSPTRIRPPDRTRRTARAHRAGAHARRCRPSASGSSFAAVAIVLAAEAVELHLPVQRRGVDQRVLGGEVDAAAILPQHARQVVLLARGGGTPSAAPRSRSPAGARCRSPVSRADARVSRQVDLADDRAARAQDARARSRCRARARCPAS